MVLHKIKIEVIVLISYYPQTIFTNYKMKISILINKTYNLKVFIDYIIFLNNVNELLSLVCI